MKEKKWQVYLIQCSDDTLYCDVGRGAEAVKKFSYLDNRAPYKIIAKKSYARLSDAVVDCLHIRGLRKANKLKAMKVVENAS